ncbi:hypothetical protein B4168_1918 [Anoxybacillus flavithermus]|nr:hypothetical protein B4168_1918 [Anoxybacillus flavithermus]OAO85574.1 hypothetical protein GT23_2477 [Parageobacillus thermoglucosidasius]
MDEMKRKIHYKPTRNNLLYTFQKQKGMPIGYRQEFCIM